MKMIAELIKLRRAKSSRLIHDFPALAMMVVLLPQLAEACPLCVESTPYKYGLQWAVLFLLPVPFVLAGTLFWWVRRQLPSDQE